MFVAVSTLGNGFRRGEISMSACPILGLGFRVVYRGCSSGCPSSARPL